MPLFMDAPGDRAPPKFMFYGLATGTIYNDTLYGTVIEDGGALADYVITNVILEGLAGTDFLNGEGDDDVILPGTGEDIVDGGSGIDWLVLDDSVGPVTVDLAADQAREASGHSKTVWRIENVAGSPEGDEIGGDEYDNELVGMDGDDSLLGGGGNDDLKGEHDSDTLDGGAGDDLIDGDGDYDLPSGTDTASYTSASAGVEVSLLLQSSWQDTIGAGDDLLRNIENLTGSHHDDTLTGDDLANTLEGHHGIDHLDGNGGNDTLRGGLGNDTLDGGEGVDRASYYYATGGVTVSLLTGTAAGAQGIDTLTEIEEIGGGAYADTLTGDDDENTLDGAAGDDLLRGGLGDDTLDGGFGSDTASWWQAPGGVTVNLVAGRESSERRAGAAPAAALAYVGSLSRSVPLSPMEVTSSPSLPPRPWPAGSPGSTASG